MLKRSRGDGNFFLVVLRPCTHISRLLSALDLYYMSHHPNVWPTPKGFILSKNRHKHKPIHSHHLAHNTTSHRQGTTNNNPSTGMDKNTALSGEPRAPTAASDSPPGGHQKKGGSLHSVVSPPTSATGGAESPVYQSDRVKEMASVEPIEVMWEHVSLRVPIKGSTAKKAVLLDVSGRVKAGQVSAIMGASGCGKTSLLNVLAGRVQAVKKGELTGRLLTNGKVREEGEFRKLMGYVTQDDTLYASLTVQETLRLAAFFKLGKKLAGKALEEYVTGIINDLGLKKCRHTAIGDAMIKGVSGGERKRASIGVELISNPSVLFLDEPTSGE